MKYEKVVATLRPNGDFFVEHVTYPVWNGAEILRGGACIVWSKELLEWKVRKKR